MLPDTTRHTAKNFIERLDELRTLVGAPRAIGQDLVARNKAITLLVGPKRPGDEVDQTQRFLEWTIAMCDELLSVSEPK